MRKQAYISRVCPYCNEELQAHDVNRDNDTDKIFVDDTTFFCTTKKCESQRICGGDFHVNQEDQLIEGLPSVRNDTDLSSQFQ